MANESTQEQFARLVGISQPAVSQLIRKGVLTRKGSIVQWTKEYTQNLREQAAGRKSDSGRDLIAERARLSKLQADKVAIEVERMMAANMPMVFLTEILAFQNSNIRARVLGIPNEFKAKHPEASSAQFLSLREIVSGVLTALSHVRLPPDLDERIKQHFRDLLAAAKSDGDGVGG